MNKWRQSIWLRYVVTYLLVLAVPFFAFSAFFQRYISGIARSDLEAEMQRSLFKIQTDFDQKVMQMRAIGIQLSMTRVLKTDALKEYHYETWKGIERALSSYLATSMFYDDIIYYNSVLPSTVFTTLGTYNTRFYRSLLHEGAWVTVDRVDGEMLSEGWIPAARTQHNRVNLGDALLYSMAVSDVAGGYLVCEMREETISGSLLSSLPESSEVYILHEDQVIFPFDAQDALLSASLQDEAVRDLGGGWYKQVVRSRATGLTYVYIAEDSKVATAAEAALSGFMLFAALISLMCCGALVMITRRHARPIERLISLADGILPGSAAGLARVDSAMRHLQARSQELEESRRQTMREHALIRLIRGKYRDEQEAEYNLARLDMTFDQPWRVMILLLREPGQESRGDEARILSHLKQRHNVYAFAYAEHSAYVMMIDMPEGNTQALAQELNALLLHPDMAGMRVRFSLGQAFQSLMNARDSYMQALFASGREPAAPISFFTKKDEDDLFYPREELHALSDALACQDRNRTAFLYDVLLMLVSRNAHTYFYVVSLLSEMIHLYWMAIEKLDGGKGMAAGGYTEQVQREAINDVDDMLECLSRLHGRALKCMINSDLMDEGTDIVGIASFISACENLESLTVSEVADRFQMNVSSLSHKFKEQMGCNISDYILTRKMSHACLLLRSTDETVGEIAAKVGYSQYSSFVRQFKRQKNMTPTAYREAWRKSREV